ncbi:MAG: FkbM family methyltransferase [Conexivisphaerales archaeon]
MTDGTETEMGEQESRYSLRNLYRLIRDVENWYDVLLYEAGLKKECVAVFRNGVRIHYIPQFFQLSATSPHGDPFDYIDVRGRDVLDVGASIGDTAIRFAMKGARRVIALEPFPFAYQEALRNIRMNGFKSIIILNKGLSDKKGSIKIPPSYIGDVRNHATNFGNGQEVEITTLEELVREYDLHDAVLKTNCEGCEYEFLLGSSYETLSRFKEIILYYHSGKDSLVKYLAPLFSIQIIIEHPIQGTLFCKRVF